MHREVLPPCMLSAHTHTPQKPWSVTHIHLLLLRDAGREWEASGKSQPFTRQCHRSTGVLEACCVLGAAQGTGGTGPGEDALLGEGGVMTWVMLLGGHQT